jgi:L-2-hydroxyglutarate oxidase LhgO
MIYLLTATGLSPGGSSTVHIYTNNTQNDKKKKTNNTQNNNKKKQYIEQHKNKLEQCGPCPVLVSYTLAFALKLRKKYGKTSVRVAEQ